MKNPASRAWDYCPDCGGSGRAYLDTGPSGLTDTCDECGGEGKWPAESMADDAERNLVRLEEAA